MASATTTRSILKKMYDRMEAHYGPTGWWPGDSAFEIAVGAVLTQNTAWTNVEKAIANLKRSKLLAPHKILACPDGQLEETLVPSGYFRVKAKRLRSFCAYLAGRYGGSMKRMARRPLEELRSELLDVNGIGPETADDILLYACDKPVFVVDAYTRRILSRHGLCDPAIKYDDLQSLFQKHLNADLRLYQEYHALVVWTGKDFCRRNPKCALCPLQSLFKKDPPCS